jgi:CRISPR-associated endoribonuclease Cas6
MRFRIVLHTLNPGRNLPLNYQYELSAWVYRCIHYGSPDFSKWLHESGYSTGTQRFKLFTFSNLEIEKGDFSISGDRLVLKSGNCSFQIAFLLPDTASPFIQGLFHKQEFTLGDIFTRVDFLVQTVERLPEPVYAKTMDFRTLSPIVIGKSRLTEGGKGTEYLAPDSPDYEHYFFQNLSRKVEVYQSITGITPEEAVECHFELIGKAKSKLILIKGGKEQQTKVKGYLFLFRLTAPVSWLKVAMDAGVGEKNSLGMGCVVEQ